MLLTRLIDVRFDVIAGMNSLRWTIELVFRWLKHLLGCRCLLNTKSEGVAIPIHCALIAALLPAQITERLVGVASSTCCACSCRAGLT